MLLITDVDRWVAVNPAKAAQGIQRLMFGQCYACGNESRPVEQVPKSLAVSYFVCDDCKLKHDEKELRDEGERLMLLLRRPEWKRRMTPMLCPDHDRDELACRFCNGKNTKRQDPYTHEVPVMCGECWSRVRRIAGGERATA